ncbi:uncharacterized protein LOC101784657 [Setaria italica]|uniref:uncharacterized protein LOC101784657 n=1 Tax=Setaria italica TaxID=4555 RepID=UPI000350DDCD|nr:uncharacterized protein LOC101784657 [Setaria italica]
MAYCHAIRQLEDKFDSLELNHVARRFNEAAYELAKASFGRGPVPAGVFVNNLHKPWVYYEEPGEAGTKTLVPDPEADPSDPEVMEIDTESTKGPDPLPDWRAPYLDYLICESLPTDKTEAQRIARRAKSVVIIDQELYKRSHTGILQRCIPSDQGRSLLHDIHAGACGHHAAPRTLIGNAFRQGFYWPTAVADATRVGLKPQIFNRLNKFGRRWVVELPAVLWSLRTTPCRATSFTPF